MYSEIWEGPDEHFSGWRTATAYVFPFDTPTTRMDSQTAQRCLALLRAREAGTLKTALSALGFLRQNDAQVLPGEISIERLSQVMPGLCASLKLCKQYKGFQYLETCIFFAEWARVLMSYVLAIYNKTLMYQSRFNKMAPDTQPESLSAANVQLRAKQQSAFSQPSAAAGSTLQTLQLRAQTKMQKQTE